MVNKREEEGREDGNEGIKEGERGKATQPSCDERNQWGNRRETCGDRRGKLVATEGRKKRSRKKRLRFKILLMQILLLVSHRLCRVDGRDEIAWTNQYCDADGEGCNIDEGGEKP